MRCKQHYTDLSSIVGVCASCLRQRLFSLIAAQSQLQSQSQTLEDKIQNSDTHPPFPRSVSPYITRRKSDYSVNNSTVCVPDHRFFSTPQEKKKKKKQHSFIRLSLITNLFRSKKRSEYLDPDPNSDPRVSASVLNSRETATSAMSSPAWFTNIRSSTNQKKQPVAGGDVMRKLYYPDRGMSPARHSDCGGAEDELYDGCSGYESSDSRKQTPWRTPAHPLGRRAGAGSVSGLNFCLSPLVRASPCRLWGQKGIPVVAVDGGDMRSPVKPHLASTKSFCANRSRKLADFGRFDANR
uniref:uncharacterized protein LOC122592136 n=1 Tax=Erigeron canadensis TaxID=72917 RepID=UPI001CB99AA2|nr:uncharacterized protein LOC122592136 [Erigeron canadensis]